MGSRCSKEQRDFCFKDAANARIFCSPNGSAFLSYVLIYPNPAVSTIAIHANDPVEKYEIYQLTGEKVLSGTVNESIDLPIESRDVFDFRLFRKFGFH